jgi:hypothetical protein
MSVYFDGIPDAEKISEDVSCTIFDKIEAPATIFIHHLGVAVLKKIRISILHQSQYFYGMNMC